MPCLSRSHFLFDRLMIFGDLIQEHQAADNNGLTQTHQSDGCIRSVPAARSHARAT
jgi:hypothetical protein